MSQLSSPVPARFRRGYQMIKNLEQHSRYLGAIIFGSVAEGTATEQSDLDVKVVVDQENDCRNINHPIVGSYKMDITFTSFPQFEAFSHDKADRKPNLQEAIIVFDKTGDLQRLKAKQSRIQPPTYSQSDFQLSQFMIYHANNKVERVLNSDPAASLYSMHANIGEVLKIHFRLKGKWWVSSKKILDDLRDWDPAMAGLVEKFVQTADVKRKYQLWSQIIDHVVGPMGGRQPIAENNCECEVCIQDLAILTSAN